MKRTMGGWAAAATLVVAVSGCGAPDTGMNPGDNDGQPTGEFQQRGAAVALCDGSATGRPLLKRLTARQFEATLTDAFPELAGQWTATFSADPITHYGFSADADLLSVTKQNAREIDATASSLGAAVAANVDDLLSCSADANRECANQFLDIYGQRLFRRPLSDSERTKYLDFFDQALKKTDFATAMSWMTRALVHSPETVYRHEIGEPQDGLRALSQHEIASELAYGFTGRPPSDELLAQADAGELTGDKLVEVARSLINSPAGTAHLHGFFEAWLEYSRVRTLTKSDVEEFPALRDQMAEETRRFVESVVINGGGSLQALLTATTTTPSAELASFYGMPAPAADFEPVERPMGQGIGVLAQGSVLATEASPSSSSPTQRGLLVMERVLCRSVPEVPPTVPTIPEPIVGETTTRQRYEELHGDQKCKVCHDMFDPIGFGFEHFDEVGRYRDDEGGLTIDPSGAVPEQRDANDSNIPFQNQEELATGLAASTEAQACVSGQLKAYAFSVEEPCLGEARRAEFMKGEIGFLEYLVSLASEPHVTHRNLE